MILKEKPLALFNKEAFRVPGWMFQLAVGQIDLKMSLLYSQVPLCHRLMALFFQRVCLHLLCMNSATSSEFCCDVPLSQYIFR